MNLAKDCIDVGLFTNSAEAHLSFWRDRVGLPYEEALEVGRGQVQHRFGVSGSVLKVNCSADPVGGSRPGGYRKLLIAQPDRRSPELLVDPDGNEVQLVPPGHMGVTQLGVELCVPAPEVTRAFYCDLLGFSEQAEDALMCGRSVLLIRPDVGQAPTETSTETLRALGYRYLTIQIHDLASEHARILEAGGVEGMAPVRLGDTAKFSFVRDPDGNWIEISQRASLTGPLD